MSWTSRLSHLGRYSPFTRSPTQNGSTTVSDADFSYITSDDLKRHQEETAEPTEAELGPSRDTDMLVLSNKGQKYQVHFPAYSMARGELSVGKVREQAGSKLRVDGRRVKMTFKGKTLKDDGRTCRSEGLRDGDHVLCVAGDVPVSGSASDDEEVDEIDAALGSLADQDEAKRRRNRNKSKKRRNKAKESGTSTPSDAGNLNLPPSQTSRAPSPRPQVPATPQGKIQALRDTLHSFDHDVDQYIRSPSSDRAKREFEHKRLGEVILAQVLLKLDAVETEGDNDARQMRKDLVRETQLVLKDLDDAAARYGASSS
ncbi:hypothetical protein B0A48_16633 [Cryoendolithus antarcticus]|uniref:BAG domain-containing protein n=1 Tax=Cryoendolithus antarcticus TaxID=1507870 RepID=A0A1V8SET4_9PEZI|nr:hypothetical protein B0A48_16633 [Cryoendolithus antarcticus]